MPDLDRALRKRLREMRVKLTAPDDRTLILRNVPLSKHRFSKESTSLLLQRPGPGAPYLLGFDQDLEYRGNNPELARAFAAAVHQQGWRITVFGGGQTDPQQALSRALNLLTSDEQDYPTDLDASSSHPTNSRLLSLHAADLTAEIRNGAAPPTGGRDEEIEQAMLAILARQPRLAVFCGESGAGKTNALYALARRLSHLRPGLRLLSVDLGVLLAGAFFEAEREILLSRLLQEASAAPNLVLALKHVELAVRPTPCGALLLADALDRGLRLLGATLPGADKSLRVYPLARRLEFIHLAACSADLTRQVLEAHAAALSAHHGVQIPPAILDAAVERAASLAGVMPQIAITLLDTAAARAALYGESAVSLLDLYLAASRFDPAETP